MSKRAATLAATAMRREVSVGPPRWAPAERGIPASVGLALAMAAFGCGGAAETIGAEAEPARSTEATATPPRASAEPPISTAAPSAAATSAAPPSPAGSAGASPAGPQGVHVEMRPPIPTALGAELSTLGLEPRDLPPLEKLDPRALRGVMRLIARSLGARCGDCHDESDFAALTPRKKIARRMWNEFVAKLALADGSSLFCDSCHEGRLVQLDRTNEKLLSQWMDRSFVQKLARKDGQSMECETCHVDRTMHFLADWAR